MHSNLLVRVGMSNAKQSTVGDAKYFESIFLLLNELVSLNLHSSTGPNANANACGMDSQTVNGCVFLLN